MNTRHEGLDALRALACIMVVAIHTAAPAALAGPQAPGWLAANILDGSARWAVPVFFMLSGWAYLTRQGPSLSAFGRLITALSFYTTTAVILQWTATGSFPGWGFLWLKPAFYHLWYFYVAIAVYAVLAVVTIRPDTPSWALWLLAIGPVLANPEISLPFFGTETGNLMQVGNGMGLYLLYALSAGALTRVQSWSPREGLMIGGILFLAGIIWTIWMTHADSIKMNALVQKHYAYGAIGSMIAAYGIFIAGLSCKTLPALISAICRFVSTRSLAVYGLHPFLLTVIDKIHPLKTLTNLSVVIIWLLVVAVSLLLASLIARVDTKHWVS